MNGARPRAERAAGAALVVSIALQLALFFSVTAHHAFNQDEGTYATAALRFAEGDLFLRRAFTDKPPLAYQLFGVSAWLFGKTEMSVKLPDALALAALLVLAFAIARDLAGSGAAVAAAALLVSSPLLARTGIGAMTDPPATAFLAGSLLLAMRNRPAASGFLLGLALATRQMAAIFVPVSFLAAWIASECPRAWLPVRRLAGRFALGGAGPVAYLVLWSAFFAREPFRWLLGELAGGKLTLGARRAGLAERISSWAATCADFAWNPLLWAVLAACATALLTRRLRGGTAGTLQSRRLLALLAGTCLAYPLLHAAIGAPLYPRMMQPVLPLLAVLGGWALVHGTGRFLRSAAPRAVAWGALAVYTLLSVASIAREESQPVERDDAPELARAIGRIGGENAVLVTEDLSRVFLFYLHGNPIERVQFKKDPQVLAEWTGRHAGRTMLLVERTQRPEVHAKVIAALAPRYHLEPVHEGSLGFLRLHRIAIDARIAREGDQVFVEGPAIGEAVPVTRETIEERLTVFLRGALGATGEMTASVVPAEGEALDAGRLERLSLSGEGVVVRDVRVRWLALEYVDARIDLVQLFAAGQLVVLERSQGGGNLSIDLSDLAARVREKNRHLCDVALEAQDGLLTVRGSFDLVGRRVPFLARGRVELGAGGAVAFRIAEARALGVRAPRLLLRLADVRINPVFDATLPALGLHAESLVLDETGVRIGLR